jgi:hypothetical protein
MHDVADMNANLQFNLTIGRSIRIAVRQCALNLDGTLRRFQGAVELDQKCVPNGLNLGPVETGKDFAKQLSMFL